MADDKSIRATQENKTEAARRMHRILGNINELIMSPEMQPSLIGIRRHSKLLDARSIVTKVIEDWATVP